MRIEKNTVEMKRKKSEFHAANIFDYSYLMQDKKGLLPCEINEEGEDIVFCFNLRGMRPFSEIKEEELEYQFRFLNNIYVLKEIWDDYVLYLSEDNLFFDSNFMPYVAIRDIKKDIEDEENSFYQFYQEIISGVLSKKYTYSQIKENGLSITAKEKKLEFIRECSKEEELYEIIAEKANDIYLNNKTDKIRLDKKAYQKKRTMIYGVMILLVIFLIYTGYCSFIRLPRAQAVIRASKAYTVQNYVDCIDQLTIMKEEQMDTYTKYILAMSYARSEALEKEELQNVVDRISIYSNNAELGYWIAIGRYDFAKAENYAKALSDDKLLIYSYMKELTYLEGNVNMNGEEKQSRMNELTSAITEIGKKYTEE